MLEENKKRAKKAVELIRAAQSESDVLDAVAVSDQVNWFYLDELQDDWNDYYGDAKRFLP